MSETRKPMTLGDSLDMVLQEHDSTGPVSLNAMVYYMQCVAHGSTHAWIIGDLPFGSYHASFDRAMRRAARLMRSGARMVKLEGVGWTAWTVRFLVERVWPGSTRLNDNLDLSSAE